MLWVMVKELSDRAISVIGLNVALSNQAAYGLYRSMGFAEYCDYEEGLASTQRPTSRR